MAKTGYFVLYWSWFEMALGEAISDARARLDEEARSVRGNLEERVNLWHALVTRLPENKDRAALADDLRAQALALRRVRNVIIHGLAGGDARSTLEGGAHIRCVVGGYEAPTGASEVFTMDDLQLFIDGADACRRGCADLRRFNFES
ncbi:hypothetical protein [Terricaulis sp.]|uniref:hypothetical protein n=1 Tax=Terricaulis sp. TaxID=2768686 RepID=UPI002AC6CA14|nr:hypothetical protein [Terricaulis sp.]MDZ4690041.1 hypothetical protein [Terricaulis sp.]